MLSDEEIHGVVNDFLSQEEVFVENITGPAVIQRALDRAIAKAAYLKGLAVAEERVSSRWTCDSTEAVGLKEAERRIEDLTRDAEMG